MSITLSASRKKTDTVTVVAVNGKTTELPDYLSEDHAAIQALLSGKKLDGIEAHILTRLAGKKLHYIILCSIGQKHDAYTLQKWTKEVTTTLRAIDASHATIDSDSLLACLQAKKSHEILGQISALLLHNSYTFDKYTKTKTGKKLTFTLLSARSADIQKAISLAKAIDGGKTLARDLANMPANECTIDYFVKVARSLATNQQIALRILDEAHMRKLGMGAFLSVTRASTQKGKLLILEYRGASAKEPFHALVGKGLTFDSGGISLKPAAGMDEMKFDMCGAASVFGCCQAILTLQAKINVLFVVAGAENMVAGNASRPGDIVKTHEGLTVEILNTDAEGRLVLCDAISYIKKRYKPKSIVDIATLTGACVIALGHHASALYSNNDALAKKIKQAAQSSADEVWQMPLWEQYQDQLSSNIADLPNISSGRDAGSITAACFLSRFAQGVDWAHLDIAGTAWISGKNKAATGRPTALLTHYLLEHEVL